jgi:hypothetical protein
VHRTQAVEQPVRVVAVALVEGGAAVLSVGAVFCARHGRAFAKYPLLRLAAPTNRRRRLAERLRTIAPGSPSTHGCAFGTAGSVFKRAGHSAWICDLAGLKQGPRKVAHA